ncbi:hypothetical protein W822_15000 [Advenella kashmirensis W13003]|uniref:Uncharacterized protein n=1 Tax=Advenella kashmirensis W13003 TaxID=1424334 RepID=V8QTQ8_9BURK|nr:hypothetical protein [Advenella kashmirensis]ETF02394.1 hypothetical protein W822_15000 [Advenella kashmirensis W13003]
MVAKQVVAQALAAFGRLDDAFKADLYLILIQVYLLNKGLNYQRLKRQTTRYSRPFITTKLTKLAHSIF